MKITSKHLVPKEHGAWAMWIVPFLIGAGVSGWTKPAVLLFFTALAMFVTHYPLARYVKLIRSGKSSEYLAASLIPGSIFVILSLWLLKEAYSPRLIYLGIAGGIFLLIHLVFLKFKMEMSVPSQVLGIAGLTLTAPAVILINGGELPFSALVWLMNFMYFSSTIFYIQLRVRIQPRKAGKRVYPDLRRGVFMAILSSFLPLVIMFLFFPVRLALPFLPGLAKVLAGSYQGLKGKRPSVTLLGVTELLFSFIFLGISLWVL